MPSRIATATICCSQTGGVAAVRDDRADVGPENFTRAFGFQAAEALRAP